MLRAMWWAGIAILTAAAAAVAEAPRQKTAQPVWEMTTYQLVFLKRGPAAARVGEAEAARLRESHVPFLNSLARSGKGVIAGPFKEEGEILGVLVLNAGTAEEAREAASADPMVKAGYAELEIHTLFAPKGVMKLPELPREMRTYYFGLLRRGPRWTSERTPEAAQIQEGHMAHINRTAETGKLVVAGPLTDDGQIRGILVYKVESAEEARALAEADPAVKAGRLVVDVHPWLVPAGSLP
jgi:uncharacterized protein YciI